MKKLTYKELLYIVSRYVFLFLIGLGNLYIIYIIFTPLTVNLSYYLISLFYDVSLNGSEIFFNIPQEYFLGPRVININYACVAGSAYYLLLILNFSIPLNLSKRIYLLIYSLSTLFLLNVLRIVLLSHLFIKDISYFYFTHLFLWYLVSMFFVVGIWFSGVYFFKISNIPFYTDFVRIKESIKKL